MTFFILGYYGFGNWGDELSLLATLLALEAVGKERGRGATFSYRVLLREEKSFVRLPEGVEVISRKNPLAVFAGIKKSDVLVVGGGSLLQDVTSFRSLCYYLVFLLWALLLRKPILFYGCGLGPFQRALSRWMVAWMLRRAFLIVRDEESYTLALRLGVPSSRIHLGVDPVFSLGTMGTEKTSGSGKVAVFLRSVDGKRKEQLCASLRMLLTRVPAMELVAFHRELDGKFVDDLARCLGVTGVFFDHVEDVFRYFTEVEMVFSMRLHPVILATLFGIPWLAVDIDPKIRAFASFFGGENLVSFDQLSPDAVVAGYEKRHRFRENTAKGLELLFPRIRSMQEYLIAFLPG